MEKRKIYVLDTTAFLASFVEGGAARLVTVQEVVDEVEYGGLAPQRLETALSKGVVEVLKPSKEAVEDVVAAARRCGDLAKLSQSDIQLLAVASMLSTENDVTIVSDDYSVQNTALHLGIKVMGVARQPIRHMIKWVLRCSYCGKVYEGSWKRCPECGGELVRIARKPPDVVAGGQKEEDPKTKQGRR